MKKIIPFLIISLFLSACIKKQTDFFNDGLPVEDSAEAITAVTPEMYQQEVKEILSSFWQDQESLNIKQDLIGLTVPREYMDLHLNLVVVFQKLEQGADGSDQALVEEALDELNDLVQDYPWIK